MSSNPKKRFAEKHPQGTVVPDRVSQAVAAQLSRGGITCQAAHQLAAALQAPPRDIGVAVDLQEARIRECQLGLFGQGQGHKTIRPAASVQPELKAAIEAVLAEGRLPCVQAWRIADQRGLARASVAQACEALQIKISKCQLGAF